MIVYDLFSSRNLPRIRVASAATASVTARTGLLPRKRRELPLTPTHPPNPPIHPPTHPQAQMEALRRDSQRVTEAVASQLDTLKAGAAALEAKKRLDLEVERAREEVRTLREALGAQARKDGGAGAEGEGGEAGGAVGALVRELELSRVALQQEQARGSRARARSPRARSPCARSRSPQSERAAAYLALEPPSARPNPPRLLCLSCRRCHALSAPSALLLTSPLR